MSARKRRYYREERQAPWYRDDFDDWDRDEDNDNDDGPEITERFVNGSLWTILTVLVVGAVLSVAHLFYSSTGSGSDSGAYRVVSVSRGKLHTEEVGTGKPVSFPDQQLVNAALSGKIKRGDVIRR